MDNPHDDDFDDLVDHMVSMMAPWIQCVLDAEPEVIQAVFRKLCAAPRDQAATISFSAEELRLLQAGFWMGTHYRGDIIGAENASAIFDVEITQADCEAILTEWEPHVRSLEDQPRDLARLMKLVSSILLTARDGELPHVVLSLGIVEFRALWGGFLCCLARRAAEGDERFRPSAN